MARRGKNPAGGLALLIVGGVIALISSIPKEVWIGIGVVGGIALVLWLFSKGKGQDSTQASVSIPEPSIRVEITYGTQKQQRAPEDLKGAAVSPRWVPQNDPIYAGRISIRGGLLYFGSDLRASSGDVEPALIEPRLPVSRSSPHYSQRQTDYWPSYSTISPEARRT